MSATRNRQRAWPGRLRICHRRRRQCHKRIRNRDDRPRFADGRSSRLSDTTDWRRQAPVRGV